MRIILAEHNRHARRALNTMLQEEMAFDLVGEAVDSESLLVLAEGSAADLVLVEKDLPGSSTETLIARLRALEPTLIVIVMSSRLEHSRIALRAGADAFVSKGDPTDWLLDTLHRYERRSRTT